MNTVAFTNAILPLVGVLIGGLITFFTTIVLENRKWKKEAIDRKKEETRKALILVFEWIYPIKRILERAEEMVSSLKTGDMDERDFRRDYPDLLTMVDETDTKPYQILFLSTDVHRSWDLYKRGSLIGERFEKLYQMALMDKGQQGLSEYWDLAAELNRDVISFTTNLTEEYMKTFN